MYCIEKVWPGQEGYLLKPCIITKALRLARKIIGVPIVLLDEPKQQNSDEDQVLYEAWAWNFMTRHSNPQHGPRMDRPCC